VNLRQHQASTVRCCGRRAREGQIGFHLALATAEERVPYDHLP
jgi:hypothetical protein